ncbi:MAG: hypothetical protein HW380_4014 [Magnetococcales bacterium]|nr:hypothetical protein [Magnetococcales bacterium]
MSVHADVARLVFPVFPSDQERSGSSGAEMEDQDV